MRLCASTELTVVVWEDDRTGTTVHLFTDHGTAVGWAWETAHENLRHGGVDVERSDDGELCISYGLESDCLRVISAVEVDAELKEAA
ncbi:hypothetical protein [Nocardia sp. NPDC049707]|uniref:hypothetical protein n=1 Tax=Nocardia sp. NPDC049707 TaxID=3154735 RepID=UPI00341AB945